MQSDEDSKDMKNNNDKNDSLINETLKFHENEINLLNNKIDDLTEINNKTKELIILKLESLTDKQNQFQIKQKSEFDSYKELINLFKEENQENLNKISLLNEELGKVNQILKDKNEKIEYLQSTIVKNEFDFNSLNDEIELLKQKHNNEISIKDEELNKNKNLIEKLTTEFNNVKQTLIKKDNEISTLNEKINNYQKQTKEKDTNINNLNTEITTLNEKINLFEKETKEKDTNIKLLHEEIDVLKSIIEEKDKLINNL